MQYKNTFFICFVCFLLSITTTNLIHAQGSSQDITFFSPSMVGNRNAQIYLPQGYNQNDTTVRYPVVYFLHGAGNDHTGYGFISLILDQLISFQAIQPVIVVKPDGSAPPYAGSFYTNSGLYGPIEDHIVYDLVTYVDNTYNTKRDRNKRCIMGHSMGAYGAMKLALKHPNIFRGVAAHSGPLDLNHYNDAVPYLLAENGGSPPYTYNPMAGLFSIFTFSMAGAFSPNLLNPPYYIDFLLDTLGNPVDAVVAKWRTHNPARLAASLPPNSNLAIYFDCGMQDEFTLYGWNTGFRDSLNLLGIPYRFMPYAGDHSSQLPVCIPIALAFLDSVMQVPVGIAGEPPQLPNSVVLYQNYPNPFNPVTNIPFSISSKSFISLKVFDALGKEVTNLVSEELPAGTYSRQWNAQGLASGVYYYRLKAGSFIETKQLIVLR